MPHRAPRHLQALALAVTVAHLASVPGCNVLFGQTPGGRAASIDQFTYESTAFQPQTVTLVDVRDQQELWSVDVPVGWRLVVKFARNHGSDDPRYSDVMAWGLGPQSRHLISLENEVPSPGQSARRLDVTLRTTPEQSPDEIAERPIFTGG